MVRVQRREDALVGGEVVDVAAQSNGADGVESAVDLLRSFRVAVGGEVEPVVVGRGKPGNGDGAMRVFVSEGAAA